MHRIGDYCYEKQVIGHGMYGIVYRGNYFEDRNEAVAIKVIDRSKGASRITSREVLDREIDILKKLSSTPHKNLVSLLDYEIAEPIVSLVMEFCNGGDFRDYLRDKGTVKEAAIQHFFRQIGNGLLFLHEKNIIHRDLKPENILLRFDGEKYPAPEMIVLKIADFGLGRILSVEDKNTAMSVCGTPEYVAPEIVERKQYDTKVDMWSIGVMIHECLVGTSRAYFSTKLKIPQNVSLEIENLLKQLNASLEIKNLLTKHLIVHDPKRRFSCDQFLSHSFLRQQIHATSRQTLSADQQIMENRSQRILIFLYLGGESIGLIVPENCLIEELFRKFYNHPKCPKTCGMALIAAGEQLDNNNGKRLRDYSIRNCSTIEVIFRLTGG